MYTSCPFCSSQKARFDVPRSAANFEKYTWRYSILHSRGGKRNCVLVMTRTATFSTEVMLRLQSLWGKCTVRSVRLHTHRGFDVCKQVMIPHKLASMLSNRIEFLPEKVCWPCYEATRTKRQQKKGGWPI